VVARLKSVRIFSLFFFFALSFSRIQEAQAVPEKTGFTGIYGAFLGAGTVKSERLTLKSRTVTSLGVRAFPGWSFGKVMLGAMGQYRLVTQITGPSKVGNTNVGGHGYYAGGGVAFKMGSVLLQGSYDFLGNLAYFKKTASGASQTVSDASGVTIVLGFLYGADTYLDFFVSLHKFKTSSASGASVEMPNNRVQETVFGMGLSF
jgi:hypothetical protein